MLPWKHDTRRSAWLWAMLGWAATIYGGEPGICPGPTHYCKPAPDQMRSPIHLFTQGEQPPQKISSVTRPAPSFHPATQTPVHFTTAPPAPGVSLAPFCPPTAKLMPFVPPCVHTFQIHTPPPSWIVVPPRPGIQLLQVCDMPGHYGPAMQRANVTLVERPPPVPPVHLPQCLPK